MSVVWQCSAWYVVIFDGDIARVEVVGTSVADRCREVYSRKCSDWCIIAQVSHVHNIQPPSSQVVMPKHTGCPSHMDHISQARTDLLKRCPSYVVLHGCFLRQELLCSSSDSRIWNSNCTIRSQLRWKPRHVRHCWMQDRMKFAQST